MTANIESISTDSVSSNQRASYWREQICDVFVELDCDPLADGFYGSISNHRLGGLQLSRVVSAPQAVARSKRQLARTNDDCLLVSLQLAGGCLVEQDGRSAHLRPGDLSLYDCTRCYQLTFTEEFEQLVLKFPRASFVDYLAAPERVTAVCIPGETGMGRIAHQFISGIVDQLDHLKGHEVDRLASNITDIAGVALSSLLTDKMVNTRSTQAALLLRIKTFIAENLRDPELSRETIASANGISVRYLNKLFESEDTTLTQWVRDQRLNHIARDLISPLFNGRSITEIAYSWGMNSMPHFSRAFKTQFGITPKAYRHLERS